MMRLLHALRSLRSLLGAGLVLGLLLGAYEVQGEKMPEWMFRLVVLVLFVLFAAVLISWVEAPVTWFQKRFRIRSPLQSREWKHPMQDLLDHEVATRAGFGAALIIVDRAIELAPHGFNPDDPRIIVTISIYNGSLYTVGFVGVEGEMQVNGKTVGSRPAQMTEGKGWWLRGNVARIRLEQWMPVAQHKELVDLCTDQMPARALSIDSLSLLSQAKETAVENRIGLAARCAIIVGKQL